MQQHFVGWESYLYIIAQENQMVTQMPFRIAHWTWPNTCHCAQKSSPEEINAVINSATLIASSDAACIYSFADPDTVLFAINHIPDEQTTRDDPICLTSEMSKCKTRACTQ